MSEFVAYEVIEVSTYLVVACFADKSKAEDWIWYANHDGKKIIELYRLNRKRVTVTTTPFDFA